MVPQGGEIREITKGACYHKARTWRKRGVLVRLEMTVGDELTLKQEMRAHTYIVKRSI